MEYFEIVELSASDAFYGDKDVLVGRQGWLSDVKNNGDWIECTFHFMYPMVTKGGVFTEIFFEEIKVLPAKIDRMPVDP